MRTNNKRGFILAVCLLVGVASLLFAGFSFGTKLPVALICDDETVLEKVYDIPFSPALTLSIFYRGDREKLLEKKFLGDHTAMFKYLNQAIINDVRNVCKGLSFPAVDAQAFFDKEGSFRYVEAQNGREADADATLRLLAHTSPCEVVCVKVEPCVDEKTLRQNTVKISTFSTSYATSSPARKHNVELAASRLDGIAVPSGESISFNETVGARTADNGFREAKVIVGGEYTAGVGGGVCQVSTTLYNAWLLSGQDAPVSRAHSLRSSYVRPGLDAMVSENSDLVLHNASRFPIYIDASFDGKKVTFTLFGAKPDYEIVLTSELVRSVPYEEYDTFEGEEDRVILPAKPREIYRSFRIFRENGREVMREKLRVSDYLPQKGKKSVKKENTLGENVAQ